MCKTDLAKSREKDNNLDKNYYLHCFEVGWEWDWEERAMVRSKEVRAADRAIFGSVDTTTLLKNTVKNISKKTEN
jgi:hypothetical protein